MRCEECNGRGYLERRYSITDNFGDDDGIERRHRYLCPACNGNGGEGPPKFEAVPCGSCRGTGTQSYKPLDEPTRFWICLQCSGEGKRIICTRCRGFGGYTDPTYGFWVDFCECCSGGEKIWLKPR